MEKIELSELSITELTNLYNKVAFKPVKKFPKKETAIERFQKELDEARLYVGEDRELHSISNGERQEGMSDEQENGSSGRRGRPSPYAGKRIYASEQAKLLNPRTKRTGHGFNSMEIVRKNDGLLYEDFIAQGGRRVDLAWDIEHGNVRVE